MARRSLRSSVPTRHTMGIERPRCVDRLPSHISKTVVPHAVVDQKPRRGKLQCGESLRGRLDRLGRPSIATLGGLVLVQVSDVGPCAECHILGISLGQSVASQKTTVPSGVSKYADVRRGVSPLRRILRVAARALYVPSAWNFFTVVGRPSCHTNSQSAKDTLASCQSKHFTSMSVSTLLQQRS